MLRRNVVFILTFVSLCELLLAQHAVDPMNRYYRLICLVHLTGSGQAADPIVPEYVVAGMAAATAASATTGTTGSPGTTGTAAPAANAVSSAPSQPVSGPPAPQPVSGGATSQPVAPVTAPVRPGIISWSMQLTDDKTMAIIHVVAVDHNAFNAILADTRPEVKVFEIGKDSKATINAAMQQYRKDFNLDTFQVVAQ